MRGLKPSFGAPPLGPLAGISQGIKDPLRWGFNRNFLNYGVARTGGVRLVLLLMTFSFDVILQAAQAVAPELFVFAQPDANGPQWFGVQTTNARRAVFAGED